MSLIFSSFRFSRAPTSHGDFPPQGYHLPAFLNGFPQVCSAGLQGFIMYSSHKSLVGFNCCRNRLPICHLLLTLLTHSYEVDCLRCSPIFLLGPMLFGCQQVLSCYKVMKIYSPAFFYEFCISPFTLRSLIHPESTMVHGVCWGSGFIFFQLGN